jgi:hypothetical protein
MSTLWHNRGIRKEVLGIKGQGLTEGSTKLQTARGFSVGEKLQESENMEG